MKKEGTSGGKTLKARAPRAKPVVQTLSAGTIDVTASTLNVVVGPKKAAIDIIVTPATVEIAAPLVSVLSYIRHRAALMRSWPKDGPRRTAEKRIWRQMLIHEVRSGEGGAMARVAFEQGNVEPLVAFLEQSGPRGFVHFFSHEWMTDLLEEAWFDTLMDAKSPGHTRLQQLVSALLRSLPGNQGQYTPAEREANRKARGPSDQKTFRTKNKKRKEKYRLDILLTLFLFSSVTVSVIVFLSAPYCAPGGTYGDTVYT